MDAICDRVEDCAVERNVSLARSLAGTRDDVEAARDDARRAVLSGHARRWCLLQLSGLPVSTIRRAHRCLSKTDCDPFFRCAGIQARIHPPKSGSKGQSPAPR